ncbi:heavy-metal-associated domain-containing protein [Paramicrobacterium chengjingii]|uniref:heavy-metal-associated domain-containing protein n=1 Tax=Paramicrobacterium chengjingii TaxID=2769067 RepID=UPI001F45254D|nr:heavy-metal-associated domain-containing protein [Microbacterium chengjingii]
MSFTDLGLTDKNAANDTTGGCCGGGACMCGHGETESSTASATVVDGALATTFGVTGMTCEHCVKAVTEELSALGTVTNVSVELKPNEESQITVTSDGPLETASVRAAVEDAGYTLA